MLDRVYPDEECIVEDIDDWCVQLLQCTITWCRKKILLLPTCLRTARWEAVLWMKWTEFAIHKITFYLFRRFVMCILGLTSEINIPLRLAVVVKAQLVWLAASSDNTCLPV